MLCNYCPSLVDTFYVAYCYYVLLNFKVEAEKIIIKSEW